MHNALCIVELLEHILSFVDDSSTASVVLVCTMWHEYGMQFLWEDVDARIFTVLGAAQIVNNRITLMVQSPFLPCYQASADFPPSS